MKVFKQSTVYLLTLTQFLTVEQHRLKKFENNYCAL